MLANTKKQKLSHHSFAIGFLSKLIFEKVISSDNFSRNINELSMKDSSYEYEKISNVVFNAGIFHDLGKIDENFQNFINKNTKDKLEYDVQIVEKGKKFNFETYPRHQEISWALFSLYEHNNIYSLYHKELCEYSIYWHHAKIIRKDNIPFQKNLNILQNKEINFQNLKNDACLFLNEIKTLMTEYNVNIPLIINIEEVNEIEKNIPLFQKDSMFLGVNPTMQSDQGSLFKNSLNYLIRSIIITADRIISSLSNQDLIDLIENKQLEILNNMNEDREGNLITSIEEMIENFNIRFDNNERNKAQNEVADKLSKINDVCVLSGPAGVGKTKIMLEWLYKKNNNKKVYIIAPKTSICFSLYEELKSEYLKSATIQLLTGENKIFYKNGMEEELTENTYFESEVVITTIDQLLMLMLSHKKIDVFLDVLNSSLIFDEYHEFLDQSAILMLFIQIIQLKKIFKNNDCLLVSATPNYFMLKQLLGIKMQNVVKIESFNQKNYNMNIQYFDDKNASELTYHMYNNYPTDTILIFNTAQKSQYSAIFANQKQEKQTIVYNSKLLNKDRAYAFKQIKKEFGKKNNTRNYVVRSGPILQASVDISTNNMITEISTIDNIYQRMGRLNRWGYEQQAQYTIFIPSRLDNESPKNASIKLALGNNINATMAFKAFLEKQKQLNNFNLKYFYALYEDFFEESDTITAYQKDWKLIKEDAKKIFKSNFEPIEYAKKALKSNSKSMAKNSLRGNSIFGLVANIIYTNTNEDKVFPTNEIQIKQQTISIKKDIYNDYKETNVLLEENRKQIDNHSDYITNYIFDNLNEKTSLAKNVSKIPIHLFLDFSRNEIIPIMLSFKKISNKNMIENNEFYNIKYNNVILGVMKIMNFNKVK